MEEMFFTVASSFTECPLKMKLIKIRCGCNILQRPKTYGEQLQNLSYVGMKEMSQILQITCWVIWRRFYRRMDKMTSNVMEIP
jgi:hypothetical protein